MLPMKGISKMRKIASVLLCILLVLSCCLVGCGGDTSPSGVVKKELQSGPWYVDMSEGTQAKYTFSKDGTFTCDATVTLEGQSATVSRGGNFAVAEINGAVVVVLSYPHVGTEVELTVQVTENGYAYWIAGCPMYQK